MDDPDVVGKWKLLDCVPTKEHFVYGRQKTPHGFWLDELYFLPGGAGQGATLHSYIAGLVTSDPEVFPRVRVSSVDFGFT